MHTTAANSGAQVNGTDRSTRGQSATTTIVQSSADFYGDASTTSEAQTWTIGANSLITGGAGKSTDSSITSDTSSMSATDTQAISASHTNIQGSGSGKGVCRTHTSAKKAGFRRVLLRGDTDFTQTKQLDTWDAQGVEFLFGIDAMPNLKARAEDLPESEWKTLMRPSPNVARGKTRARPEKVKEKIVRERGFRTLTRTAEAVAVIDYRPVACRQTYRLAIVRQTIAVEKGQTRLFDEIRYRFYLINKRRTPGQEGSVRGATSVRRAG